MSAQRTIDRKVGFIHWDCIEEADRPGHVCGTFVYPCIHHQSLHCLACCVRDGQNDRDGQPCQCSYHRKARGEAGRS